MIRSCKLCDVVTDTQNKYTNFGVCEMSHFLKKSHSFIPSNCPVKNCEMRRFPIFISYFEVKRLIRTQLVGAQREKRPLLTIFKYAFVMAKYYYFNRFFFFFFDLVNTDRK